MANKLKMLIAVLTLSVALTSLMALPAAADTMNLSYRGYEAVTVTYNYSTKNTGTAEFYSTSQFQGQDWIGYCVDLGQGFASPLEIVSTGNWVGTGSKNWLEAAWLLENYAPGTSWLGNHGSVDYGNTTVMNTIQAVQLAIWEVIYNQDTTLNNGHYYTAASLTSGSFRATGTNATTAGSMLEALDAAKRAGNGTVTLSGNYNFVVGQSSSAQDLLLASKAAATPEPATLVMAASGLGMMAWRRRRQKKA